MTTAVSACPVCQGFGKWWDGIHHAAQTCGACNGTGEYPLWPCLSCGARNRLRDTTCRHCGDPKPEG